MLSAINDLKTNISFLDSLPYRLKSDIGLFWQNALIGLLDL